MVAKIDKLKEILEAQNKLQRRLGYDISNMDYFELTDYIKEQSIHLTQELHEMLYELPGFKPWKDYNNMPIEKIVEQSIKAREEFIDMLHFTLNIALALGMDAHCINSMYMKKNKENHVRQDEGYTHDKSFRG